MELERFAQSGSTPELRYGYPGQEHDAESVNLHLGVRELHFAIGRFSTPDSIVPDPGNPQTLNRYAYALNNPVKYTDPSGHATPEAHSCATDDCKSVSSIPFVGKPMGVFLDAAEGTLSNGGSELRAGLNGIAAVLGYTAGNAANSGDYLSNVAAPMMGPVMDVAMVGVAPEATAILTGGPTEEAGAGATSAVGAAEKGGGGLPDSALVCRGGTCTAERFTNGTGVSTDAAGKLQGVSTSSWPGKTVQELSAPFLNNQVGVSTVGEVRAAGGEIISTPTRSNPYHPTLSGVTAEQATTLFTPTIRNPNIP